MQLNSFNQCLYVLLIIKVLCHLQSISIKKSISIKNINCWDCIGMHPFAITNYILLEIYYYFGTFGIKALTPPHVKNLTDSQQRVLGPDITWHIYVEIIKTGYLYA